LPAERARPEIAGPQPGRSRLRPSPGTETAPRGGVAAGGNRLFRRGCPKSSGNSTHPPKTWGRRPSEWRANRSFRGFNSPLEFGISLLLVISGWPQSWVGPDSSSREPSPRGPSVKAKTDPGPEKKPMDPIISGPSNEREKPSPSISPPNRPNSTKPRLTTTANWKKP